MPSLSPDLPIVEVTTRKQWRAWLAEHHAQKTGVWVATRKRAAVPARSEYVSPRDINEECLCHGWIDSKPARIDDDWTALLCTPRKPGSGWSKVNKERIETLERQQSLRRNRTGRGARLITSTRLWNQQTSYARSAW